MDSDLVIRAQHGDEEAFASLAVAAGDRLHAVAHRILRDIDLAEDATQQALLAIWRDLPQLRDPARFDAWSYRLLVRACYTEARRTRHWTPNLHLLPADEPAAGEGLSSVVDRDQLERGSGDSPSTTVRSWCFTTTSTCRSPRSPTCSAFRLERFDPDCITRCAACVRPSRPTPARRRRRLPDEHRSRRHAHRSVVAGGGPNGAPGPRPGRRARPAPRDPTAPCQLAGAEVPRHAHPCADCRRRGRRGRA